MKKIIVFGSSEIAELAKFYFEEGKDLDNSENGTTGHPRKLSSSR